MKQLTVKQLLEANKRLQQRISELELGNKELVRKNGNLVIGIKELREKLKYKETLIEAYRIESKSHPKVSSKGSKHESCKSKQKQVSLKKRQRMIHGILKNTKRYKLSSTEIGFLQDICERDTISDKQYKWYSNIVKRGRPNYENSK